MKLYVVCAVLIVYLTEAKNPGLKTRITDAGLTYASQVAIEQLSKSAKGQKIPDQSGRSGDVSYELSNVVINSFNNPSSGITVTADGLNWKADGLGLSINGHFHYKYHGIIPISDSGNIDVSVSGVNFNVGISLGVDGTGRPKIASSGCSCSIGSLGVHFHGGAAWIYNLFKGVVEDALKKQLNGQLCTIINKAVNTDASQSLAKLKEIYWTSSMTEAPFDPPSMPPISSTKKMFYISMSDYVFNTLAYEAQIHKMLEYNLTQKDLPAKEKDFLNTTCVGTPCIGQVIPQIGKKYPNRQVTMFMSSDISPNMSVTNGKVNVLSGGTINMFTVQGDIFLLTLNATMTASVSLNVKSEKIYGSISEMKLKLHVVKSNVGQISDTILNFIANTAIIAFAEPQLNKLGAEGIPLPVTDNVHFINTEVTLNKDTLVIGTDLQYQ
ncbi:bactericidal permeability-increasing protein-like [Mytilus californianus]|uniref:bactericidal permeability-increasing protein-like n=1 Tax=Mytilus californianus TaxID=6549 RepID=UPI002247CE02|nr:bactericidal permeability-increasing protein-like [Mytilus californianus]